MWLPEGWDYHSYVVGGAASITVPAGGDNLTRFLTEAQWSLDAGTAVNLATVLQVFSAATLLWQWEVVLIGPGTIADKMSWHGLAAIPGETLTVKFSVGGAGVATMLKIQGYDA